MDKPTTTIQSPAPAAAPADNYITSSPPPAYPPNDQPQESHEMPKYAGAAPPPQQQQNYYQPPVGGGPQNFAPYGTPLPALGPHPAPIECPECRARGVTAVEYSSGGFTHALGAVCCLVTCLGCIPYFFSSLKDATHKCCKCGIPLATYHRSGRTEVHWHSAYNN
ncbi:LITAF lipopolysaccharide-induced TNF factor [Colletotrichum plurivorum]|uniref:LITAF lipopolysaccharide-induced TNF factor n=1 Tax=Colletotrichum plurivorum TaxID=2175906 RepID=A0A8H6K6L8_9PEZI|nr:LITAF lipopolysaccharide-induced TNF factor [Colletotrichum plurivorum]